MSLSSFLLGGNATKVKGKAIDTGLDDLFKSTASTAASLVKPPTAFIGNKDRKRKEAPADVVSSSSSFKRAKGQEQAKKLAPLTTKKAVQRKSEPKKAASPVSDSENEKAAETNDENSSEDEEAIAGPSSLPTTRTLPSDDSEDSDEEGDPSKLVHETLLKGNKGKSVSKKKYVPEEETSEQRDARTIFVGNVPIETATSRPLQKQLKRHILTFVPTAKIESTRFRSIAFSKPTAPTSTLSSKDGRQHDRDRAASWRESKGIADEDAIADKGKTFLSQQNKKRIFFIKQELHKDVDSINAYIVFAHPPPAVEDKPSMIMDPHEAARVVIKEADGSMFHGHSLRVDAAVKSKSKGKAAELGGLETTEDPKATIFVGNLDFACKEEDVRVFFEKLIIEEKGAAGESKESKKEEDTDEDEEGEAEDEEGGGKASTGATIRKTWVKRVRIIRDKDTLLGKGFGYVQFTDRSCVDEILALEESRLKFAKRKLRIQRCKTLPGASKPAKSPPSHASKHTKSGRPERSQRAAAASVSVPKGDPTLGSKIAALSKEERKKVKSTDADRVARRLAKKKAKALADKGIKSRDGGKDKERVRKRPAKEKLGAAEKKTTTKARRVRSGNALAKMNRKK
ncbi:hypothetical protein BDY19DRAFT_994771 [Irpex rosettiformis]|uniref:Uncharacterized protein n=1 Tax=Irpex rosettiformis TaxID=378272 RepID=A0ACB8U0R2_9APHY|nr:hypothetical protein BDY19DRAFT_994771 [Irpex rosettiformis]